MRLITADISGQLRVAADGTLPVVKEAKKAVVTERVVRAEMGGPAEKVEIKYGKMNEKMAAALKVAPEPVIVTEVESEPDPYPPRPVGWEKLQPGQKRQEMDSFLAWCITMGVINEDNDPEIAAEKIKAMEKWWRENGMGEES